MTISPDDARVDDGRVLIVRRGFQWLTRDIRVRDQLLTSIVNLAMPIVAALVLSSHEVGAVWIAFGAYQVAMAVSRGFIAIPGQMAIGRQAHPSTTPPLQSAAGVPIALGLVVAVAAVAVRDDDVRRCLFVLASTLPVLLLLDCARHWAYAVHRVDIAVRASSIWAITQAVVAAVVVAVHPTAATLIAAWALPGVLAGLVLIVKVWPLADPAVGAGVSLSQRSFLAADAMAGQLAAFAVPALAGVAATLSDVGVFQNSRILFRPVNVLLNLLLVAGIPLVNLAKEGRARLHRTRTMATRTVAITCGFTAAGLVGYIVADVATDVELSWIAIAFAAAESIAVGPYIAYSLLATMMMRAGTLLIVRVAAVVVQIVGVLLFARLGAGGLSGASLAGMLVPSIVVPLWVTRLMHRENPPVVLPDYSSEVLT